MTTETLDAEHAEPLEYVRQRLKDMQPAEQTRIALAADTTQRTVYNILAGKRDAKYGTVMALVKALKEHDAAAAEAAKQ